MAEITEKKYLDEKGLKKVLEYVSDSIPNNALIGSIDTVILSANNNGYSVGDMPNNSQKHVIFVHHNYASDPDTYTVTIPTTYKTPDGNPIELIVPKNGFAEVNFMKIGGVIYARGV